MIGNAHFVAVIHGIPESERRLLRKLPREVRRLSDMSRVARGLAERCRTARGLFGWFHRWNCGRQIRKVSRAYKDPLMANATGERKVLAVLLKLDDGYHVLCEVSLTLPHFVWHNGAYIDK